MLTLSDHGAPTQTPQWGAVDSLTLFASKHRVPSGGHGQIDGLKRPQTGGRRPGLRATHPEVPKCWPDSRSLTFGWTPGLHAGFRPSSPCPPPDTAQLAPSRCRGSHFIHPKLVPKLRFEVQPHKRSCFYVSAGCPNGAWIFFFLSVICVAASQFLGLGG